MQVLNSKIDRLTLEMISVRNELSTIKAKLYGDISETTIVFPKEPFKCMEQYNEFETQLQSEEFFKQFVKEVSMASEKSFDKFIRNTWKKLFSSELAEKFSWRGTSSKNCIRGSHLTLAIRQSFKTKFALTDDDFDKVTQKFFQYAHDRIMKLLHSSEKKSKSNGRKL